MTNIAYAVYVSKSISKKYVKDYINNLKNKYKNNISLMIKDFQSILHCDCISCLSKSNNDINAIFYYFETQTNSVVSVVNKRKTLNCFSLFSNHIDNTFDLKEHVKIFLIIKVIKRFKLGRVCINIG